MTVGPDAVGVNAGPEGGSDPFPRRPAMAQSRYAPCIEACNACADACDHCASACLAEEQPKPMAHCIALDMDCAAACRFAAGVMSRDSEFAQAVCGLCADVCDACAQECGRHDMDHCKACAEACRRCAEECRRMAQSGERGALLSRGASAH